MNKETSKILNDEEFEKLYQQLTDLIRINKNNISDDHLKAIGMITVKFQKLEFSLKILLGFLLDIHNRQRITNILTSGMPFKNILEVLSALSKEVKFHRISDLDLLIKKAKQVEEIRNQIIHSLWTYSGRLKTKINNKRLVHKFEEYSPDELMNIANMIDKIDSAIMSITADYIDNCVKSGIQLKGVKVVRGR